MCGNLFQVDTEKEVKDEKDTDIFIQNCTGYGTGDVVSVDRVRVIEDVVVTVPVARNEQKAGVQMIIHKCDRCGKSHEQKKGEAERRPSGWIQLKPIQYRCNPVYEIYSEYAIVLKIPTEKQNTTVGERLIDILEDIAVEATENCEGCQP